MEGKIDFKESQPASCYLAFTQLGREVLQRSHSEVTLWWHTSHSARAHQVTKLRIPLLIPGCIDFSEMALKRVINNIFFYNGMERLPLVRQRKKGIKLGYALTCRDFSDAKLWRTRLVGLYAASDEKLGEEGTAWELSLQVGALENTCSLTDLL